MKLAAALVVIAVACAGALYVHQRHVDVYSPTKHVQHTDYGWHCESKSPRLIRAVFKPPYLAWLGYASNLRDAALAECVIGVNPQNSTVSKSGVVYSPDLSQRDPKALLCHPQGGLCTYTTSIPGRLIGWHVHPSWEDPVAVLLVIGGFAGTAAIFASNGRRDWRRAPGSFPTKEDAHVGQ
jgi:hypothetical protein